MSNQVQRIPRNARCPCGSGLKYKKCCLLREAARLDAKATVFNLAELRDNHPCPCKKGKTFGQCCGPALRKMQALGAEAEYEDAKYEEEFGEVRQPVTATFHGVQVRGRGERDALR